MGVFDRLRNKPISDAVAGTLALTARSGGCYAAYRWSCRMQGVLTGPGIGPIIVQHVCMAPTDKWPQPGQHLPVRVERTDWTHLDVLWDQVPCRLDLSRHHYE